MTKKHLGKAGLYPEVLNGKPSIRDTHITVNTALEYLAAGKSADNAMSSNWKRPNDVKIPMQMNSQYGLKK